MSHKTFVVIVVDAIILICGLLFFIVENANGQQPTCSPFLVFNGQQIALEAQTPKVEPKKGSVAVSYKGKKSSTKITTSIPVFAVNSSCNDNSLGEIQIYRLAKNRKTTAPKVGTAGLAISLARDGEWVKFWPTAPLHRGEYSIATGEVMHHLFSVCLRH